MATDKRPFTLRLQDDNFEKVRIIAERSKRSMTMQIEYIIEQFVLEYEKAHGDIEIPNNP